MFRKKITILFLIFVLNGSCWAQKQEVGDTLSFSSPLDFQLFLSDNFGEIRPNHFHSGIDLRTQGETGKKVFAACEGYVSRIKIAPDGYGRALYINHPSGYETVYGHLTVFEDTIENYIRQLQYARHTFSIDVQLPEGLIPIKKGELIALSGNSGGSTGPHLHFEIRKTPEEHPVNPLLFHLPVKDTIAPLIFSLKFYPLNNKSYIKHQNKEYVTFVQKNTSGYSIPGNSVLPVWGKIGLGIETLDCMNLSAGEYEIYSVELRVDTVLVSRICLNELAFEKTRYANSCIDYKDYYLNDEKFIKLFKEPGNIADAYDTTINRGAVNFCDGKIHKIQITVKDAAQDSSTCTFLVRSTNKRNIATHPQVETNGIPFYWNKDNQAKTGDMILNVPAFALYDNISFVHNSSRNTLPGLYSPTYNLQHPWVPLQRNCILSIKPLNLPERLRDKTCIVQLEKNKIVKAIAGQWENNFVTARINEFGSYAVGVDTVAPIITPVNISGLAMEDTIKFRVTDNLSGIKQCNGFIDNNWVLFEYDPKNELVYYVFDPKRLQKSKPHSLLLQVNDMNNNISEYSADFYW